MNPIYSHLYIDLQHKTIDSVNLKQYDHEARYIRFYITDNGNPYILTPDIQAEIKIYKPDDTKVVNFAIVDCISNHITVEITSQITSMYGILHADISLFREGKVISTMPFLLNVERSSVQNEDVISADEYGILEDLITEMQTNENHRQLNEEDRKEAENVRNLNENTRKNNENIRIENENARNIAEIDRENNENIRIENEKNRLSNEGIRQTQETDREEKTSAAIQDAQKATQEAIAATTDLQNKLNSHHFVLTDDKDMANGVPSLDTDRKIPIDELRDATTENKGIVQLTDSITSSSTTTAATPNSVKVVYDALNAEQNRLSNVENKSSATIRGEITKSNITNALGYTPYTPNEVDNKLSALETNIDWKESVNTFNDIAAAYPNPQDGWTVNVKDTDYTYRYNGNEWVAISANAIPKATNNIDGLLSKEDHMNYDDANNKKHIHQNKSVLDSITEDILNKINNFVSHNHDDRYYTKIEIEAKLNENTLELTQANEPSTQKKGDFWLQEY